MTLPLHAEQRFMTAAASPEGQAEARPIASYIATSELVLRRLGLVLVELFA